MTRCPECESDLELDGYELDVGETINCPECSIELRVTNVRPDRRRRPTTPKTSSPSSVEVLRTRPGRPRASSL